MLQGGGRGPKGSDFNAMVAREHAPELAGKIACDVRLGALVALKPGPFGQPGKWSSANSAALTIWLQGQGIPVRVNHVETALLKLGQEHQIDPLEDYLLGLQWDGVERIGSWLQVYAGVVATPVSSLIGSKFLIGMVARALKPGCQMDYALTLEAPQGEGKSSLIRILGGQYGSESLPDFHSRDAQQIAGESWIIEIADLAALGRSAIEQFKSFITTTADSFVPKYERHKVTRKRWCVFVMTVNPNGGGYLFDETGNRRIWPVTVGTLDLKALARDRDQLFAEAVFCFQRGDSYWPENREQHDLLAAEQEERTVRDDWETLIGDWLKEREVGTTDTLSVATDCIGLTPREHTKATQMRIAKALKKLGYQRKKMRDGGGTAWKWTSQKRPDL